MPGPLAPVVNEDDGRPVRNRQRISGALREEIGFGVSYFALATASCIIATLGLLENSAPIIIGAMLIAPLMTPIVALALAIVSGDFSDFRSSLVALLAGAAVAVAVSLVIATVAHLPIPGSEILGRGQPNLLDLGVALAAGAIAGFARIDKRIASSIGGAAIAVALMPPLCVVGIGLAIHQFSLAYGALLLFTVNLLGITLACAVVFVIGGLATKNARHGLLAATALVIAVAIPLVFTTVRLIRQQQLEDVLRASLRNDTQTFKSVQLVSSHVDWVSDPIRIRLLVRMEGTLTSHQVGSLQSFIAQRLHADKPVALTVDITPVTSVTATSTSADADPSP